MSIPAGQAYTDTGIVLSVGQVVHLTATGAIYVGAFTNSAQDNEGPDGQAWPGCQVGARLPFTAPGLPCWSLIGTIRQAGTAFEIGSSATFTASSSGELYLGVNDNFFPDNSGSWTVTISVSS